MLARRRALSSVVALGVVLSSAALAAGPGAQAEVIPEPRQIGALQVGALQAGALQSAAAATTAVTVKGAGYGHGVGLSQFGAYGMAKAGATGRQIVSHYFTGVSVTGVSDARQVLVNVVHQGRAVNLSVLSLDGSRSGRLRLAPSGSPVLVLAPGDVASVTPSGSLLALTVRRAAAGTSGGTAMGGTTTVRTAALGVSWSGTTALAGAASRVVVASSSTGAKLRSYRWGTLRLTPLSGRVEAVTSVDLHTGYLRGLAEMPSSWPAAALQAQAIVARSYALVAVAKPPRASCGGCQVWDDERSQMYTGWAKEGEASGGVNYGAKWVAAVTATQTSSTAGLAVVYRGAVVQTFYASSTGGRTRDPQVVWGSSVPYLRTVADPWSLNPTLNPRFAAWSRTVTPAKVAAAFGLGDVRSVNVTARDGAGAALQLRATSSTGAVATISGETFRSRLGLPSAWVSAVQIA